MPFRFNHGRGDPAAKKPINECIMKFYDKLNALQSEANLAAAKLVRKHGTSFRGFSNKALKIPGADTGFYLEDGEGPFRMIQSNGHLADVWQNDDYKPDEMFHIIDETIAYYEGSDELKLKADTTYEILLDDSSSVVFWTGKEIEWKYDTRPDGSQLYETWVTTDYRHQHVDANVNIVVDKDGRIIPAESYLIFYAAESEEKGNEGIDQVLYDDCDLPIASIYEKK